jgi:hypothetical protein
VSGGVEGVMENREVPRIGILGPCADMGGAWSKASSGEERGSRGKPGFPRATKPEAREAAA